MAPNKVSMTEESIKRQPSNAERTNEEELKQKYLLGTGNSSASILLNYISDPYWPEALLSRQ